jgi:hypothetical protein
MRTRRSFQPTVDFMPSRIAPSTIGLPAHSILTGAHLHPATSSHGVELDSSGSGTSNPVIAGPAPSGPPPTLPC